MAATGNVPQSAEQATKDFLADDLDGTSADRLVMGCNDRLDELWRSIAVDLTNGLQPIVAFSDVRTLETVMKTALAISAERTKTKT